MRAKCDGATPSCSTCKAVYQMECVYDNDSDRRRKSTGGIKKEMEEQPISIPDDALSVPAAIPNDFHGQIVSRLQNATWPQVTNMVTYLKNHGSLDGYEPTVEYKFPMDGPSLVPSPNGVMLQADQVVDQAIDIYDSFIAQDIGTLEVDDSGSLRHFGRISNLGLVHSASTTPAPSHTNNHRPEWTNVTNNADFVGTLINNYFTHHHPIHLLLSQTCFIQDFRQLRSKYCSSLLVNAMLAIGCHYSNEPELARSDPSDPSTVGAHFFSEAKRLLLEEEEHPSLTLTQGLALMALYEVGCGNDSAGWMYSGRAFRAATDLGLNVRAIQIGSNNYKLSRTEEEVRKITFWGLFMLDKVLCMHFGRVPQIPNSLIGIEKPRIIGKLEEVPWPGAEPGTLCSVKPAHIQGVAQEFYSLCEILGDALNTLHSPKAKYSVKDLCCLEKQICEWASELPEFIALDELNSPPAVITLHMLYHATQILLFRPFAKIPVAPSSIPVHCVRAASELASLFTSSPNPSRLALTSHMLLSAGSIIIEDSEPITGNCTKTQHLMKCAQGLRSIAQIWPVGDKAIHAVEAVAARWKLQLPTVVSRELDPATSTGGLYALAKTYDPGGTADGIPRTLLPMMMPEEEHGQQEVGMGMGVGMVDVVGVNQQFMKTLEDVDLESSVKAWDDGGEAAIAASNAIVGALLAGAGAGAERSGDGSAGIAAIVEPPFGL